MMKHTFEIQLKTCHRNLRKVFSFNINSIYNSLLLFISISTVLKIKNKERKFFFTGNKFENSSENTLQVTCMVRQ